MTISDTVTIRDATSKDIERITEIYKHHVLYGTATFEVDPPSVDEMVNRWINLTEKKHPYLVAEIEDKVVGYGYVGPYRPRVAFFYTLEDSIYVDESCVGKGVGSKLLEALIRRCEENGYRQMVAVVGDSGNQASIKLHKRHKFKEVGTLTSVGYKFGKWLDVVLLQRELGESDNTLP